jgi:hypothetical protein
MAFPPAGDGVTGLLMLPDRHVRCSRPILTIMAKVLSAVC